MTRCQRDPSLLRAARAVSSFASKDRPEWSGRVLRRAVWGALLAVLLAGGCAAPAAPSQERPRRSAEAPAAVRWQPVDSLNALLPEAVRVFAAQRAVPPLRAWYVRIDEPSASVTTRIVASDDASDGRETVSSFAHDLGACVVANGGYFAMSEVPARPVGLLMTDGVVRAPATASVERDGRRYETARAALGLGPGGVASLAWATTQDDTLYAWPAPPAHRPGRPAPPLRPTRAQHWNVRDALSAGPMLLVDGQVRVTAAEEVFFGTSIPEVHPRTAAGITPDGALILMVVDGRQPQSLGVDLQELARLMQSAGATDALNLDGGGSSALVVRGVRLNRPAGAAVEREVASALVTFCQEK